MAENSPSQQPKIDPDTLMQEAGLSFVDPQAVVEFIQNPHDSAPFNPHPQRYSILPVPELPSLREKSAIRQRAERMFNASVVSSLVDAGPLGVIADKYRDWQERKNLPQHNGEAPVAATPSPLTQEEKLAGMTSHFGRQADRMREQERIVNEARARKQKAMEERAREREAGRTERPAQPSGAPVPDDTRIKPRRVESGGKTTTASSERTREPDALWKDVVIYTATAKFSTMSEHSIAHRLITKFGLDDAEAMTKAKDLHGRLVKDGVLIAETTVDARGVVNGYRYRRVQTTEQILAKYGIAPKSTKKRG